MKIVVIGGTGKIGRQVVRSAAQRGHHVVAFAHQPDPIIGPGLTSARPVGPASTQPVIGQAAFNSLPNVTIVPGDVFDPETLRAPIAGAGAVVFAAGSPGQGPTRVRSAGIAAVSAVMRASGVSRLVAVSRAAAFISPRAVLTRKVALRYFLHKVYRNPFLDVERMEDELLHTDLNWSVVRAAPVHGWPGTGNYLVVPEGQLRREWPVSAADLAEYIVTRATDQTAGHDIVTVTGTGRRGRPDRAAPGEPRPGRQESRGRASGQPTQKEGQPR